MKTTTIYPQTPRVRFFLDAVIALCNRHGLAIAAPPDVELVVVPLDREHLTRIDEALDWAPALTPAIDAELARQMGDDGLIARLKRAAEEAPEQSEAILTGSIEVGKLRRGLAMALRELESMYHAEHGYPLDSPEIDALRALLPKGTNTQAEAVA